MLIFALIVVLLSMVFSAVVSYAMYLKLHSDVTTFAEESSHKSDLELLELRATLNRLHEKMRSRGQKLLRCSSSDIRNTFSVRRYERHGPPPRRNAASEIYGHRRRFARGGTGLAADGGGFHIAYGVLRFPNEIKFHIKYDSIPCWFNGCTNEERNQTYSRVKSC